MTAGARGLPTVGFIWLGNVGGKLAGSLLGNGIDRWFAISTLPPLSRSSMGSDVGRFAEAADAAGRRRDHLSPFAGGLGSGAPAARP